MPKKSKLKLSPVSFGNEMPGQRLARLRKEPGLTEGEVAKRTDLTQVLASNCECDRLRLTAQMAVRFVKALFHPKPQAQHAVKRVDLRPESDRESPALLATASFLLFLSFVLPFIGGLAEAAHLAPPLTDGGVLFGIILGAIACGVIGLSLVGKSSLRVKSFLPGLLCVLLAGLPIVAIRLAEMKHLVIPASPVDFWLALEAVISAPILALLGLTLIRKGPLGLWNNVLSSIALLVVVVVMGFGFLGMIGVLL